MLGVKSLAQLADALHISTKELEGIARVSDRFSRELILFDPINPSKQRVVVDTVEPLRSIHVKLFSNLLKPNLVPSVYSHGGISGRGILTNAEPHRKSTYYFTTDILSFFPSIRTAKVQKLFEQLECSESVASLLAKLCTCKGRLAQGMVVSPILADRLMKDPDRRIAIMCEKLSKDSGSEVFYTRYVDDLTISAMFPLESGSTPRLVIAILKAHGFKVNPAKQKFGRIDEGLITKLRIKNGKIEVSPNYLSKVDRDLSVSEALARGEEVCGSFCTHQQMLGRIHFIGWVSPNRLKTLLRRCNAIDWSKVETEARSRGLVMLRKSAKPKR